MRYGPDYTGCPDNNMRYGPDYTGCPDNMRYGPDYTGCPDNMRYGPDYTGCPDNMRYGPDCVGSIIDSSILPSVSNFLLRRLFEAAKRPSLKPQELTQLKTPVFPSLSLSCSIM